MRLRMRYAAKLVFAVTAVAVLGLAVKVLWNLVVPAMFIGTRAIDYPHALGLLVLCRILFGGFRGRGGSHGRHRWRQWSRMTPEERTKFRGGRGCHPDRTESA